MATPGDGRSRIYVRDRATGHTQLVSGAVHGRDVNAPSLSRNGRFVTFLAREGKPDGTLAGLRTSLWLHDRHTGETQLVSRADGRDGAAADGYHSEPSVSDNGRRVVFTSTSGSLVSDGARPSGLPGVFVRDMVWGSTKLLSAHRARRGGADAPAVAALSPFARLRRIDSELKLALGLGGLIALAGLAAALRRLRRGRVTSA